MSNEDDIRAQVLEKWAARFAIALPITLEVAREFMSRVEIYGSSPEPVDWLVKKAKGHLTEDQVYAAMFEISDRVTSDILRDSDLADPDDFFGDKAELDMSKKIFDMGENVPPQHFNCRSIIEPPEHLKNHFNRPPIEGNQGERTQTQSSRNLWDQDFIKEQIENLGLTLSQNQEPMPILTPEESGGVGSERVVMMHPKTYEAVQRSSQVAGTITYIYGFKIQISNLVKEGQVLLVSPTPLNVSEKFRFEKIEDEIPRIYSRMLDVVPEQWSHLPGTLHEGDVLDDLGIDKARFNEIVDPQNKEPEDDREIAEERVKLGERRLRDGKDKD